MVDGDVEDWVDVRVELARELAPVGDATAAMLKELIRKTLADRRLSTSDQVRLAKELLATLSEGSN